MQVINKGRTPATRSHRGAAAGPRQQHGATAVSADAVVAAGQQPPASAHVSSKPVPLCRFYLRNRCNRGSECKFIHGNIDSKHTPPADPSTFGGNSKVPIKPRSTKVKSPATSTSVSSSSSASARPASVKGQQAWRGRSRRPVPKSTNAASATAAAATAMPSECMVCTPPSSSVVVVKKDDARDPSPQCGRDNDTDVVDDQQQDPTTTTTKASADGKKKSYPKEKHILGLADEIEEAIEAEDAAAAAADYDDDDDDDKQQQTSANNTSAKYDVPCNNGPSCLVLGCPYLHIPREDFERNKARQKMQVQPQQQDDEDEDDVVTRRKNDNNTIVKQDDDKVFEVISDRNIASPVLQNGEEGASSIDDIPLQEDDKSSDNTDDEEEDEEAGDDSSTPSTPHHHHITTTNATDHDSPCSNGPRCSVLKCPYLHIPALDHDDDHNHNDHDRDPDSPCSNGPGCNVLKCPYLHIPASDYVAGKVHDYVEESSTDADADSNNAAASETTRLEQEPTAEEAVEAATVQDVAPVVSVNKFKTINKASKDDDKKVSATGTTPGVQSELATKENNDINESSAIESEQVDKAAADKVTVKDTKKKKKKRKYKYGKKNKKNSTKNSSKDVEQDEVADTNSGTKNRVTLEAIAGKTTSIATSDIGVNNSSSSNDSGLITEASNKAAKQRKSKSKAKSSKSSKKNKSSDLDAKAVEFIPQTPPSTPTMPAINDDKPPAPTAAPAEVPTLNPPSPPSRRRKAAKSGIKPRPRSSAFDLSRAVSPPPGAWPSPSRFNGVEAEVMVALRSESQSPGQRGKHDNMSSKDSKDHDKEVEPLSFLDAVQRGESGSAAKSGVLQGKAGSSASSMNAMPSPKKKSRKPRGKSRFSGNANKVSIGKENETNGKARSIKSEEGAPVSRIEESLTKLLEMGFSSAIVKSAKAEFLSRATHWTEDQMISWALYHAKEEEESAYNNEGAEEKKCEEKDDSGGLTVHGPKALKQLLQKDTCKEGNGNDDPAAAQESKKECTNGALLNYGSTSLEKPLQNDNVISVFDGDGKGTTTTASNVTTKKKRRRNKDSKDSKKDDGAKKVTFAAADDPEAKARADFWQKERNHQQQYTNILIEWGVAEYARQQTALKREEHDGEIYDRPFVHPDDVKDNELLLDCIQKESEKAYKAMYGSRTGGTVKVIKNVDGTITGRIGKVRAWDETSGAYRVVLLPTKAEKLAKKAVVIKAVEAETAPVHVFPCDLEMTQNDTSGSRTNKSKAKKGKSKKKSKKAATKNDGREYTFAVATEEEESCGFQATITTSVLDELASNPDELIYNLDMMRVAKDEEVEIAKQQEEQRLFEASRAKQERKLQKIASMFAGFEKAVIDLKRKANRIRQSSSKSSGGLASVISSLVGDITGFGPASKLVDLINVGVNDYFVVKEDAIRTQDDIEELLSLFQSQKEHISFAFSDGNESHGSLCVLFNGDPIVFIKFDDVFSQDEEESLGTEGKSEVDYHAEVLGVSRNASKQEITKAYRKVAPQFHPDQFNPTDDMTVEEAVEHFKKVSNAKDYMLDRFNSDDDNFDINADDFSG